MSSHDTTKPTGGVAGRRDVVRYDPNDHLMDLVMSQPNLQRAWKRVRDNYGAPGVDNMPVDRFAAFARENWDKIRSQLLAGTYQPFPVKRVEIPKPTGGKRPLGIPAVVDRVIQQAVAQVLGPFFEPGFSDHSYGFRPNRSAHGAIRKLQGYIKEGYRWAVDMDLEKFFDEVNHDVLMHRVARKVSNKHVLRLIGKYLRAGVMHKGRLQPSCKGVPQGGPLSPLLSNILLDELDKELENRGHRFVRYADDFVIVTKSRRAAQRVMIGIKRFLERNLKLKVNESK
jgi:RNA-directed DNA polymerase